MRRAPRRRRTPEETVAKPRRVDLLRSQGRPLAAAVRMIAVTPFTRRRRRKEFDGLKSDQGKRLEALEKENERLRQAVSDPTLRTLVLRGAASGNFSASPAIRLRRIDHVVTKVDVSARMARRVPGRRRSTQRKAARRRADNAALTADIVALATECGRYGCRRIAGMLLAADAIGSLAPRRAETGHALRLPADRSTGTGEAPVG